MYHRFFKDKNILILGGSGSIGNKILNSLIPYKPRLIKILSRNKNKQKDLKKNYLSQKNLQFILADITDYKLLRKVSQGVDIIFHCASIKQTVVDLKKVDVLIKTNILGSLNVRDIAFVNKIPVVISLSSDKAVDPSGLMGLTKNLQERIFFSKLSRINISPVRFVSVRLGNVIGSSGSLSQVIINQINQKQPITITDSKMTRFYISEKEAVEVIFWAVVNGKNGDIIIKKMKSAKTISIVNAFLSIYKKTHWPINYIGVRHQEKLHDYLIFQDELTRIKELDNYYIILPADSELINSKTSHLNLKMDRFYSNNKRNFFTQNELQKYIEKFIQPI